MLFRSLKEHYLEVSKMTPPPKVTPPSPFEIVKGSLEGTGAVLKKYVGNEEISLFVMRLAHGGDDEDDDGINQLFLHVAVSKPNQAESLHFLCGLYPDALGIHSVSMRPKLEDLELSDDPARYTGPSFDFEQGFVPTVHHFVYKIRGKSPTGILTHKANSQLLEVEGDDTFSYQKKKPKLMLLPRITTKQRARSRKPWIR